MKNNVEVEQAVVSPLFIDKATFTFPIGEQLDEVVKRLQKLYQSPQQIARADVSAYKSGHRYRQNYHLLNESRKRVAFFQIAPYQATKVNALRISFNPNKIGSTGCQLIHDHLKFILGEIFEMTMQSAKCTRLDLSVDVKNVSIEGLAIYATGKLYSSIWASDFDKWGNLFKQTIYIGSTKSDVRIKIYDKRAELERPWPPVTRIELRLDNLRSASLLHLLRRMNNPFLGIKINSLAHVGSDVNDAMAWFLDSCRFRNAHAAIRLAKDKARAEMCKDLLATATAPWWNPEKVWSGLVDALRVMAPFLTAIDSLEKGREGKSKSGTNVVAATAIASDQEDEEGDDEE